MVKRKSVNTTKSLKPKPSHSHPRFLRQLKPPDIVEQSEDSDNFIPVTKEFYDFERKKLEQK